MTKQTINVGVEGNDATGDAIREAFQKTNENFNELYSAIGQGDGIAFTSLTDAPEELEPAKFLATNDLGTVIVQKAIEGGDGIEIINNENVLTINNTGTSLANDPTPALGGHLNANSFAVANISNPSQPVADFLGVNIDSFAISKGYAENSFVLKSGATMTGALQVPAGATGSQVPRASEVIKKSGDTMTGALLLNSDPTESSNPLTAATKNYVDTSSFSSTVNLYVSTNGSDFRFDTVPSKRGRALAYAFKTINRACQLAEEIINDSSVDLGPYEKPIFYNDGASRSVVSSITLISGTRYTLRITHGGAGTDPRKGANYDIRAGNLIKGSSSGGIVKILEVGIIDTGTDVYVVEYVNGSDPLAVNEELSYGSTLKKPNICIFVESGTYEEHYPIRLPENVSLVGDDMRRVLIKPKAGPSASIYSNIHFYRDTVIDVESPITIGTTEFGYHYLTDPTVELYTGTITNPGNFLNAQAILNANREFIQEEVIGFVNTTYPSLTYDEELCKRDVGLILDAIQHDLIYGGYTKALDAGISYFSNASALVAITTQKTETLAALNHAKILAQRVLQKTLLSESPVITSYQNTVSQVTDFAFNAEAGASTAIGHLMTLIDNIIDEDASFNFPKNNEDLDVFLLNNATILTTFTGQGHGGFLAVLDPEGQIITKSPYVHNCVSFSRSINSQIFAGGMLVDGFSGNLQFTVTTRVNSTEIDVSGLDYRQPQTPCAIYFGGVRFLVDYISDYNASTGTATLILNPATPDDHSYHNLGVGVAVFQSSIALSGVAISGTAGQFTCTSVSPNTLIVGQQITISGTFGGTGSITGYSNPTTYRIYATNGTTTFTLRTLDDEAIVTTVGTPTGLTYTRLGTLELQTAGNASMVTNNYTQVNDLGYGIIATNNGLVEAVSVFTYYCHAAYYAVNGGQIRSLNGSCAYGLTALKAEGSDPNEIPDVVDLVNGMVQTATAYTQVGYPNQQENLVLYVNNTTYTPLNLSEVEIDHTVGTLTGVQITGTAGQFSFVSGATLVVGQRLTITGTFGGTGSITGYTNPTTYYISATNGTSTFTLKTLLDAAIVTTAGTPTGLTYTVTTGELTRYEIASATTVGMPAGVVKLNLGTAGNNNTATTGLAYDVANGDAVTIRIGSNFLFESVDNPNPIRPSTALKFDGHGEIYRATAFSTAGLPVGQALVTTRENYEYIPMVLHSSAGSTGAGSGIVGDGVIRILELSGEDTDTVVGGQFAWGGTLHTVTTYTPPSLPGTPYAVVGFTPVLTKTTLGYSGPITAPATIKVGLPSGANAEITVRISTMRATSHDMLDIGTGSFADTNYPNNIFGEPNNSLNEAQEVREVTKGRVFFTSTDQYGNFKVGDLFRVDQGTGTVTFAASIALSNLDGIGFKRGVTISEFSIDDSMTDNATDTVPVEQAVRGYIDKRLGLTHSGGVSVSTIGPGFMARDGSLAATADLGLGGNKIINLANPVSNSDAANKLYVDGALTNAGTTRVGVLGFTMAAAATGQINMNSNKITNLATPADASDAANKSYVDQYIGSLDGIGGVTLTTPASANVLAFTGTSDNAVNAAVGGDVTLSLAGNTLTATIANSAITNSKVSATAGIVQSKLSLNDATAAATVGAATKGISAYSSTNFDATSGFVSIKSGGVALSNIANITSGTVIGNNSGLGAAPSELSFATVVQNGGALYNGLFSSNGVLVRTGINTYGVVSHVTTATNDTIVLRDASAGITANIVSTTQLNVDGNKTLDTSGTAASQILEMYSPQGSLVLSANGSSGSAYVAVSGGQELRFNNTGNTFYVGFKAGTLSANRIWTLPTADGTANQVLKTDGSGNLGWVSAATGTVTSVSGTGTVNGLTLTGTVTGSGSLTLGGTLSLASPPAIGGTTPSTGAFTTATAQSYAKSGTDGTGDVGQSGNRFGVVYTRALSTGLAATTGTVTGTWTLTASSSFEATYADLAEYYEGDQTYEVGTVLMLGGDKEVTLARGEGTRKVAGVVSNTAAYTMNKSCPGFTNLIALQGRVPVKVVGKISKGDMLVVSMVPGVAMASSDPLTGSIIGKALQDFDSDRIGMIEVMVGRH